MKRERRVTDFLSIYAAPILIGCTILCLGWGVMRTLWEIGYKNTYRGDRSFPYYLSANWGDPLILSVICALISFEMRRFRDSVRWRPVVVAGTFGLLVELFRNSSGRTIVVLYLIGHLHRRAHSTCPDGITGFSFPLCAGFCWGV